MKCYKNFKIKDGKLMHRPKWKVFINSILRIIQPWNGRKFLITSKTKFDNGWCCVGYGFGLVAHYWRPYDI